MSRYRQSWIALACLLTLSVAFAGPAPSTPPFHEAARDAEAIALDIWETARESDEDTPQTAANQATAANPLGARYS